ncbi:MAG: hypothetical protein JWN17_2978 [Frankiales bacterium]|nr:hypothetical protein [Frankiales bacterium]
MSTARDDRPTRTTGAPARLSWAGVPGVGQLDGGWWPRSTDVAVELEQLLAACPQEQGRVSRVSLCSADWPLPHPTRSVQRGLPVKVGWFSGMERHTVTLGSSAIGARRTLLLVVPEGTTEAQAERDLAAASTPTSQRTTQLLAALA